MGTSESSAALVTGASRGIGRAIALELARAGLNVGIGFARSRNAALETSEQVEAFGVRAVLCPGDIAERTGRDAILKAFLDAFGRIDVLVNNAALAVRARVDLLEASEESFDQVLAANLKGPYFLTQAAARLMIETREAGPKRPLHIVNISSISEYTSSPTRGEYCVAKAGIAMMTRLFADRLAGEGIFVNEIRPGIIATDMTRDAQSRYEALIAEGLTPIRRWGQPEDVAKAVAAIVTGAFPFTTGAAFDVDGGFGMRRL